MRIRSSYWSLKLYKSYVFEHQSDERIRTKNASLNHLKTHQNHNLTRDQKSEKNRPHQKRIFEGNQKRDLTSHKHFTASKIKTPGILFAALIVIEIFDFLSFIEFSSA